MGKRVTGTSRNLRAAPTEPTFGDIHRSIALHMGLINALLGGRAKLTLLARMPGDPDSDLCISDDEYSEMIEIIRRCRGRSESGIKDIRPEENRW